MASTKGFTVSSSCSLRTKTLKRHTSSEPIVLAAEQVEQGPLGNQDSWAIILTDDAQQSLAKFGIGLRVAHGLPQEGDRTAGDEPGGDNDQGSVLEAGIAEKLGRDERHD